MTIKAKARLYAILAVAVVGILSFTIGFATATSATRFVNEPEGYSPYHTFFSATTTNATSTANVLPEEQRLKIAGAKKATFYFSRGGATGPNTGSSKFELECSPDGSTWVDCPRLLLNDLNKTASSTVWITAATSTVSASLDIEHHTFNYVRCQVVEVTDGDHTCRGFAQF